MYFAINFSLRRYHSWRAECPIRLGSYLLTRTSYEVSDALERASLVRFTNVKTQIPTNPAGKDDRKFYRTLKESSFQGTGSLPTPWRFLKAAHSVFEFYRLPSNQKSYACFQIWLGGPYQRDTSYQCLWRQSEISALITKFNSFLCSVVSRYIVSSLLEVPNMGCCVD